MKKNGMVPNHWVLEDALALIRTLQPETRKYGYHLCLGGGVLNNGESQKDLDLYFLPLGGNRHDLAKLHEWLTGLWGDGEPIGGEDTADYPDEGSYQALKLKFKYSGLRIDVFVVGEEEEEIKKEKPSSKLGYWNYYTTNGTYAGITRNETPRWRATPTAPITTNADIDRLYHRMRQYLDQTHT